MLSVEAPPRQAGGLTVFADHSDPRQFYFAAPDPHLARTGGQPMLDLFTYAVELRSSPLAGTRIPDELGAGFLTMGVDCSVSTGQRQAAVQALAQQVGLDPDQISLSPIPYLSGTVSVIALDAASGAAAAAAAPVTGGRPTFVEAVIGTGTASLLGDLRSIFSLSLSQEGATFLEAVYAEGAAPVGVVYDLKFLGLRPSVHAVVRANMARVYEELGGKASVGCGYVRADVEGVMSSLEQRGAITVELTTQAMGEEAASARQAALSLFTDRVVQDLLKPSPKPPNLAIPTLPGGQQSALVTLSLKAVREEELREVAYDYSERSPEQRTHAPQAFLPTMLSAAELAARTHHVDLASDFFELLQVLVSGPSAEEFQALGLRSVSVDLSYGDGEQASSGVAPDTGTLAFRPGSPSDLTWAVRRKGRATLGYTAALTYEFERDQDVASDALTYRTPPRPETGRTLSIRPYDDLAVLDVEVDLGRLDPGVRDVDVTLDYRDPASGFAAHHQLRLTPAAPAPIVQRTWQVRLASAGNRSYSATSVLTFDDGAVLTLPPVSTTSSLLRVDAPFRGTRSLLIQPNVTTADVTSMTVEVAYEDQAAGYARRFTRILTPAGDPPVAGSPAVPPVPPPLPGPARWSTVVLAWPILDPAKQEIRFRVTTAAGGVVDAGQWQTTTDPSILVGDVGRRTRTVEVRLIGPPMADVGVDAIQVQVGVAGSPDDQALSAFFDPSAAASQTLTLPSPPDAPAGFRVQTTAFRADGTQHVTPWAPVPAPLVIISTRNV